VIHDDSSENYILHIEFQVKDPQNMVSRMLLYRAFLYHKYQLPIKQYVFYVGEKSAKMPVSLSQDNLTFQFELRSIIDFDYEIFLNSDKPEEVILAILSDFGNHTPKEVIQEILDKILELTGKNRSFMKYTRQLEILSNLRSLQKETVKQLETMPFDYDLENDI
jgi:hypothetical protein